MKKVFKFALVAFAAAAVAVACQKPAQDQKQEEQKEEQKQDEQKPAAFDPSTYEVNEAMAGADTWGLIGPAQTGGWDADTDLTKVADAAVETWKGTIELAADKFKFRGNDTWGDYDLGGGTVVLGAPIVLSAKGGDMAITEAGTYDVTLYPTIMVCILEKK